MRPRIVRSGLLILALSALSTASAAAQPATGPRETVDQRFTTTRPSSSTGTSYTGTYHAAGNPRGNPPYMRRMVFYPPRGTRYDSSVPDRCSASDIELEARGPAACPAGSRLGTGTAEGLFYEPVAHGFVFDHFNHTVDIVNNTNEQIILVKSEGYTVVRGHIRPDGSIEFVPTTCFPASPTGHCVDDYILQLRSSTVMPVYTRTVGGRVRGYVTTPPKCPARGYWGTTVRFWWADASVDSVVTRQPCQRPRKSRRRRH